MLAILFKNNETGEVLVKKLVNNATPAMCGYHSTPPNEVKDYQRFYDSVFGKGKYTFYLGEDTPHYQHGPYGNKG